MANKNILITGASSGIGKEVAIYLSEKGATVILVGRNVVRLEEVASDIGKNVYIYPCNLCETGQIERIFQYCKEHGILLDGMVHSAGIAEPTPVRMMTMENLEKTMKINFQAFVDLGKQFYRKKYSQNDSSIVAISSIAAMRPAKGQVAYASSKAALNTAVRVMSQEFLKRKIRVNAIMPSYVATPLVSGDVGYGMNNGIEDMPLGVIEPKQIAYLVEFLLSDKSKHITGAAIPVTSGV